jgi:hypothetical protein
LAGLRAKALGLGYSERSEESLFETKMQKRFEFQVSSFGKAHQLAIGLAET